MCIRDRKYPLWLCVLATGFFFVVDFAFWASNLLKFMDGGLSLIRI